MAYKNRRFPGQLIKEIALSAHFENLPLRFPQTRLSARYKLETFSHKDFPDVVDRVLKTGGFDHNTVMTECSPPASQVCRRMKIREKEGCRSSCYSRKFSSEPAKVGNVTGGKRTYRKIDGAATNRQSRAIALNQIPSNRALAARLLQHFGRQVDSYAGVRAGAKQT